MCPAQVLAGKGVRMSNSRQNFGRSKRGRLDWVRRVGWVLDPRVSPSRPISVVSVSSVVQNLFLSTTEITEDPARPRCARPQPKAVLSPRRKERQEDRTAVLFTFAILASLRETSFLGFPLLVLSSFENQARKTTSGRIVVRKRRLTSGLSISGLSLWGRQRIWIQ